MVAGHNHFRLRKRVQKSPSGAKFGNTRALCKIARNGNQIRLRSGYLSAERGHNLLVHAAKMQVRNMRNHAHALSPYFDSSARGGPGTITRKARGSIL